MHKRFIYGGLMETDTDPDLDPRLKGLFHPLEEWPRPPRFNYNNTPEASSLYGTIRRNNGYCSNPGQDDFLAEIEHRHHNHHHRDHHQPRRRLHHNLFHQQQQQLNNNNISSDKTAAIFFDSSLSSWLLSPVRRGSSELMRRFQGQVPQALFDVDLDLNRETHLRHGFHPRLQVDPDNNDDDDGGMMDG